MANIENKFILFLADPQFTKEEINKFHKALADKNINSLFKKAYKIKSILSDNSQLKINNQTNNLTSFEKKILNEVTILLRNEANMTVRDSVKALSMILKITPPSNKKSFQEQILFLVEKKGGPEVINAAYKVRNSENNNSENSHWPLLDNE